MHNARFAGGLVRFVVALILAAALVPAVDPRLAVPPTAWAQGYTVNAVTDPGDGTCDGTCTLRDAILAANASGGADTITFSTSGIILLGAVLPDITEALTIDGSGQVVAVDGANAFRVLLATAPLTLTALTVQHGNAVTDGGGAAFLDTATLSAVTFLGNVGDYGGGAYFDSTSTVTGAIFRNNKARFEGGGAYFEAATAIVGATFISNTAVTSGGGVYVNGVANIDNTNFISNTAGNDGGGARIATANITGGSFISNTAYAGGGARIGGPATIQGTLFMSNTAEASAGGAYFNSTANVGSTNFISNTAGDDAGGARFGGTATVSATNFTGNIAGREGGGARFGPATVTGATFSHNRAAENGGGAHFAGAGTISGSTFMSNTAGTNGGGASFNNTAAVTGTSFLSNTAGSFGGGVYAASTLQSASSVYRANQAATDGGGVYLPAGASAALDNNVLAANTVLGPAGGAEISLAAGSASLRGRHNTFAAATAGSGTAVRAGATQLGQSAVLTNTIFHGYAVGVLAGPFTPTVTLDGVLWSGVTTPTQGSAIAVTNAYTGAAAFVNAGAWDFHLTPVSAALNVGVSTGLSVDFDGQPRPDGPAADLGADEWQLVRLFLPLITR